MFEIDKERFGAFLLELRKKRDIHRNSLQKNYLYQTRQSANGNGG